MSKDESKVDYLEAVRFTLSITQFFAIAVLSLGLCFFMPVVLVKAESASGLSQKPVKYTANRNTIICRRTTDFDQAQEAVNQLDMQWFSTNPSCRFIKKGATAFLMKESFPYSNFCFGTEKSCDLSWGLTLDFDKARVKPPVLAKGTIKVCRSQFATDEDFPNDVKIPARLQFIDTGTADFKDATPLNITVVITKNGVLKHTEKCTTLPAELLDDTENNGMGAPAAKTLSANQNRVLGPDGIDGQDDQTLNLPDLVAYVAADFK